MSAFEFDDQRLPTHGISTVKALTPDFIAAAQSIYDDWRQDDDGMDEVYGAGGICHDIADRFVSILTDKGIDSLSAQASVGENHVYAVAALADGVWSIDISPYAYETGGGYVWRKRPDVVLAPDDLALYRISQDVLTGEQLSEGFRE